MTLEEIRRLKQKYGYSNAQLSDASGVPLGTVNKVLSGQTAHPRHDTLVALARPLQTMEELELLHTLAEPKSVDYKYQHAPADSLVREEALRYGVPQDKGPGDFTIKDYYALPDDQRVELIDGVFYDMASPTIRHQQVALEVVYQIKNYLQQKGGDCVPFISPVDVQLDVNDDKTVVQPDVLIVCDPSKIHEDRIIGAPDFILEVISPSTKRKDYLTKGSKYVSTGVREYWIIDTYKNTLMIYDEDPDEPVKILPLEGMVGIGIYQNELMIDLDRLK